MLWDVRALMKPALSVIDMIPNVHRTPALAALRRAVYDGRPLSVRLSREEKELAFYEGRVNLTSPIGARLLYALYKGGHLKMKKPGPKSLPSLEAYIATEAEFRAKVGQIEEAEAARQARLAEIVASPEVARVEELTPALVDKVMNSHLGFGVSGAMQIAGVECHRLLRSVAVDASAGAELRSYCWWQDAQGVTHGDRPEDH